MKHYVAYHSIEKWGDYAPSKKLNFYSGKSESYLSNSIGANVWVIVGTREKNRTNFRLVGKYSPTQIRSEKGGGFRIIGSGEPFFPQIELRNFGWFSRLFREQRNFSRGFCQIGDEKVLKSLEKLSPHGRDGLKWNEISIADYVKALKSLPDKYREILVLQFQSPRHEISTGQLAALLGYDHFVNGNGAYGRTARLICKALRIEKPPFGQWFAALSEAYDNNRLCIWIMRPNLVEAIKHLGWARELKYQIFFSNPDELTAVKEFAEGRVQLVAVNIFERNAKARKACLNYYGHICSCCDFDFEEFYGALGRDFIHVHHLNPLSEIGEEYKVDPVEDLRPVCPNCHAMLHRKTPALTIDELREIIQSSHM